MAKRKFEYQTRYYGNHELNELDIKPYLNQQGGLGWELVQIIERPFIDGTNGIANRTFIFKKQIQ